MTLLQQKAQDIVLYSHALCPYPTEAEIISFFALHMKPLRMLATNLSTINENEWNIHYYNIRLFLLTFY